MEPHCKIRILASCFYHSGSVRGGFLKNDDVQCWITYTIEEKVKEGKWKIQREYLVEEGNCEFWGQHYCASILDTDLNSCFLVQEGKIEEFEITDEIYEESSSAVKELKILS
jgi:hypothetical protein